MKFPFSFRAKVTAEPTAEHIPEQSPEILTEQVAKVAAQVAEQVAEPSPKQMPSTQSAANTIAQTNLQSTPDASPANLSPEPRPSVLPATTQLGQMDSMVMSAEDIIAAYKIFLKRLPESMEVITPRVGLSAERVLLDFMSSNEFTSRPEVASLVFAVGKKILDERAAKNPAPTAPSTSVDGATESSSATSAPTPATAQVGSKPSSTP